MRVEVPADELAASRVAGQLQLWENMWDEKFVKSFRAFERWSTDTLPLAGEYFRETIKELIWENRLHKNELVVGGKLDLTTGLIDAKSLAGVIKTLEVQSGHQCVLIIIDTVTRTFGAGDQHHA